MSNKMTITINKNKHYILRVLILSGVLFMTSNCAVKKNSFSGKYYTFVKFPHHSFEKTLRLKKSGKFLLFKTSSSIHPAIKTFGKWEKSNDSLFLFKRKIIIHKHIQNKKIILKCKENKLIDECKIDTLIINKNELNQINLWKYIKV
jgi:hypothetical protein